MEFQLKSNLADETTGKSLKTIKVVLRFEQTQFFILTANFRDNVRFYYRIAWVA